VSFGLAGLVEAWGGAPRRLKAAGDTVDGLAAALGPALSGADILVTIGGASVGDYDLVKPAAERLGARIVVDKIALRPGKPTWFATGAGPVLLGLPGNPASALVCAHLFLRPLMDAMSSRESSLVFVSARLAGDLPANGPREHYIRARLEFIDGALSVRPFEAQDSSLLSVFQQANALIRLAPKAPALAAGARVDVLPLMRL
jgi:molybdopterin molybdotransferase